MENSNMNLAEALMRASAFLEKNGFDPNLARTYWLILFDQTLTDYVQIAREKVNKSDWDKYVKVLHRIVKHEPIQYILGWADFMGNRFKVTPATLIPREETVHLVQLASQYLSKNPEAIVLDIGTGSGIIAISLAMTYPKASIYAIDISRDALKIAKENAKKYQVDIEWFESNLLSELPKEMSFDLIVSNPPYIGENELDMMDESVKKHEPKRALFANKDGYDIYERLAKELPNKLNKDGQIVLEIGYNQGQKVKKLFEASFSNYLVEIKKDFNQLDRNIVVWKGESDETE